MSKSEIFTFRGTAQEKRDWPASAEAAGTSITEVCRKALKDMHETVTKTKGSATPAAERE